MKYPLLFAVLFAVAHTQSPLYYSNQNQYFLHALASRGDLAHDWLATTADPTPLFTAAAALTAHLGEWTFQAAHFAALAGYFLCLWHLVPKPSPGFALAVIVAHAGIVRWAADRLFGADYAWFLQCGLANQYLFGPGLQPSVIGVLLLAALVAVKHGRPVLAAAVAAACNYGHATYLLPAALLVAGIVASEWWNRRWKSGFLAAAVALAVAVPVVAFHMWRFGPTDAATFAEAQRILADVRIPHHARPARWFDIAGGFQLAWMALGLTLLRRSPLFVPLAVAAALALAGTAVVLATDHPTAALAFPWRISAVLVPVATAVILARLLANVPVPLPVPLPVLLSFSLLSAGLMYGLRLGYREPEAEDAALAYVTQNAKPGDVYLVPARFPKPSNVRGVYSATFAPPPNPAQPVYFEMARFRLATGARLYVDFKAIPYKDAEVLEWHRRVAACEAWFAAADWDASGTAMAVAAEGVTHVVAPTKLELRGVGLVPVYDGGAYRVYRVAPVGLEPPVAPR